MFVYDAAPSGLSPADLRVLARQDPAAARTVVAGALAGAAVLVASPFLPLGWAAVIAGLALIGWSAFRSQRAAQKAMVRPSLVGEGRPTWHGVRRALFALRADDPDAVALRIAAALDDHCGAGLVALEGRDPGAVARTVAWSDGHRGASAAWGVGRPPALQARGDTCGIWMHRTPPVDGGGGSADIALLADLGRAESVLREVIAGLGDL